MSLELRGFRPLVLLSRKAQVLLLGIGLLLGVLCVWRMMTNVELTYSDQIRAARFEIPAPAFEGLDARNQLFRLEKYLGRHRILLVFFDARNTAAADPILLSVNEAHPALDKRDIKVVAVSTALPQENRTAMEHTGEYPFPLISDIDLTIHRRWGRLHIDGKTPLPGVFLIDRKGNVTATAAAPEPVHDVHLLLKELTGGPG